MCVLLDVYMCMPECVCVYYIQIVSKEARRRHLIHRSWT